MIWFLPARKSTFLAYSQQQEKLRKFLQKYGLGSSFPLDIIIISANHVINASSLTPVPSALLQKSANLTPILCFVGTLLPAALLRCNAFSSPGDQRLNHVKLSPRCKALGYVFLGHMINPPLLIPLKLMSTMWYCDHLQVDTPTSWGCSSTRTLTRPQCLCHMTRWCKL